MASEEHTRRHANEAHEWIHRNYQYPNLVGAREGQRILSPWDTCIVRGSVGGFMGGVLGAGIGVLMNMSGPMGGLGAMPPIPGQPQINAPPPPAAQVNPNVLRPIGPAATAAGGMLPASAAANVNAAASTAAMPALSSTIKSVSTTMGGAPTLGPMPRAVPVLPNIGIADPIYGQSFTPEMSSWQQVKVMARDTGRQAKGNFKTWGMLSGTYAMSECTIEQWRGRSDELNPLLAGCASGAILAGRSGPQGIAIGCASFAAFSYAMEKVMHSFSS